MIAKHDMNSSQTKNYSAYDVLLILEIKERVKNTLIGYRPFTSAENRNAIPSRNMIARIQELRGEMGAYEEIFRDSISDINDLIKSLEGKLA